MKTAIATDSNSGIFEQEARAMGISVIPMPVIIEGTTYYEGVDLTPQALYQAQLAHKDVSSSQQAPARSAWASAAEPSEGAQREQTEAGGSLPRPLCMRLCR